MLLSVVGCRASGVGCAGIGCRVRSLLGCATCGATARSVTGLLFFDYGQKVRRKHKPVPNQIGDDGDEGVGKKGFI